jgi:translation initiation factor 4A
MSNESGENNKPSNNEEEIDASYIIETWDDLDLDPSVLRGIFSSGFEKPSPIQKKGIKPIMMGKDIIGQAQSGTGKTATFTIGALSRIDLSDNNTQILALSPTKELAEQTAKVFKTVGSMMNGLKVHTMFGGSPIDEGSCFSSKNVPHVICGCPGRVYDSIRRDKIAGSRIKLIIIDEADEMLSAGFKDQIFGIFQNLHDDVQVALFSATIPEELQPVIEKLMRNPVKISIKAEMLSLEGISQYYVAVDDDRQKYLTLKTIYSNISLSQCIIYCNSVKRVSDLYDAMKEDDFPVSCIHSSMDKQARQESFNDFKSGKSRVLISSNVTSRGIDIQQVGVVINFDVPKCVHNYLHRIGRSGRWGRKGMGINFITRRDISKIKEIEKHYESEIKELPSSTEFLQTY